jgi:hypothetical protein
MQPGSPFAKPPGSIGAGGFFIPGSGMPGTNEFPSTYYPTQQAQYPPKSPTVSGIPGTNELPSTYYPTQQSQYPPKSPTVSSPYTGGFVMPTPASPSDHGPTLYRPFTPTNQMYPYGPETPSHTTADYQIPQQQEGMRPTPSAVSDYIGLGKVSLAENEQQFTQKPGKIMFMYLMIREKCVLKDIPFSRECARCSISHWIR